MQHSSGTFAQLDLRNSYRPLDAVPSLAASWAVSDSLAFVTDKKIPWEVPYDDMCVVFFIDRLKLIAPYLVIRRLDRPCRSLN